MRPKRCQFPLPPGERLLVFDGVCKLCSGWARFILRFDRDTNITLTTIQSPSGRAILNELELDTGPLETLETLVYLEDGWAHFKSDAIFKVAGQLPPPWPVLRIFALVPRPIRDWCYTRIARNRYRLFGIRSTCFVPGPGDAARFRD